MACRPAPCHWKWQIATGSEVCKGCKGLDQGGPDSARQQDSTVQMAISSFAPACELSWFRSEQPTSLKKCNGSPQGHKAREALHMCRELCSFWLAGTCLRALALQCACLAALPCIRSSTGHTATLNQLLAYMVGV